MFNKVLAVKPLDNFVLSVTFENGQHKYYDIKPLFDKYKEFTALQTINGLYELVTVDMGGYGISWNDEIDISCNELYNNGMVA